MATLHLNLTALKSNVRLVSEFCKARNLDLLLVTKLVQSRASVLNALGEAGARIADVHAANFRGLSPVRHPVRAVLRPRLGDAQSVSIQASRVFLSDPALARRLGELRSSFLPETPLEVTLMVETGDLRDGVPWDEVSSVVRTLAREPGLQLTGLGTNLGCMAGALPDAEWVDRTVNEVRRVVRETGVPLGFSLGGTVFWDLLRDLPLPPEFNELRIGEAAFFGWNTSLGRALPELSPEVFRLDLEVLEVWSKDVGSPENPGFNAFGEKPVQTLTGHRRRAVLDGGENLAPYRALTPLTGGCILVGETHEYTVVDCEAASGLTPGSTLSFRPGYEAVARCCLTPFLDLKIGELE